MRQASAASSFFTGYSALDSEEKVLENYVVGQRLGEGAYGSVYVLKYIPSGESFALKILQKGDLFANATSDDGLMSVPCVTPTLGRGESSPLGGATMQRTLTGGGATSDVWSNSFNDDSFAPFTALVVKQFEQQIISEATVMQSLEHPHVVKFYKFLISTEAYYFVMELAEGGELFDLILSKRYFSEKEARRYFQQLISAIDYCHRNGVAHKDLKAENLLLSGDGRLLVCDFGFSSKSAKENVDDPEATFGTGDNAALLDTINNGVMFGTLHYMSPEMITSSTQPRDYNEGVLDNPEDPSPFSAQPSAARLDLLDQGGGSTQSPYESPMTATEGKSRRGGANGTNFPVSSARNLSPPLALETHLRTESRDAAPFHHAERLKASLRRNCHSSSALETLNFNGSSSWGDGGVSEGGGVAAISKRKSRHRSISADKKRGGASKKASPPPSLSIKVSSPKGTKRTAHGFERYTGSVNSSRSGSVTSTRTSDTRGTGRHGGSGGGLSKVGEELGAFVRSLMHGGVGGGSQHQKSRMKQSKSQGNLSSHYNNTTASGSVRTPPSSRSRSPSTVTEEEGALDGRPSPAPGPRHVIVDPFQQDLWSAGVILFFMLTGRLPFDGRDEEETLFLIQRSEFSFTEEEMERISAEARDLIVQMLSTEPTERPTAEQIITGNSWFRVGMNLARDFPHREDLIDAADRAAAKRRGGTTAPSSTLTSGVTRTSFDSVDGTAVDAASRKATSFLSDAGPLRPLGAFHEHAEDPTFLDFSTHHPVSEEEERVLETAFRKIDADGYGSITRDQIRDMLTALHGGVVAREDVSELVQLFTGDPGSASISFKQFRDAWVSKDLAHIPFTHSSEFQLANIIGTTMDDAERKIVRELRAAFDSLDDTHEGVVRLDQLCSVFERGKFSVDKMDCLSLMKYFHESEMPPPPSSPQAQTVEGSSFPSAGAGDHKTSLSPPPPPPSRVGTRPGAVRAAGTSPRPSGTPPPQQAPRRFTSPASGTEVSTMCGGQTPDNASFADLTISFDGFLRGIVKNDILLKHPLGRKLAAATNLAALFQSRNVTECVRHGFVVVGLQNVVLEKLASIPERLMLLYTDEVVSAAENIYSFRYLGSSALTKGATMTSASPMLASSSVAALASSAAVNGQPLLMGSSLGGGAPGLSVSQRSFGASLAASASKRHATSARRPSTVPKREAAVQAAALPRPEVVPDPSAGGGGRAASSSPIPTRKRSQHSEATTTTPRTPPSSPPTGRRQPPRVGGVEGRYSGNGDDDTQSVGSSSRGSSCVMGTDEGTPDSDLLAGKTQPGDSSRPARHAPRAATHQDPTPSTPPPPKLREEGSRVFKPRRDGALGRHKAVSTSAHPANGAVSGEVAAPAASFVHRAIAYGGTGAVVQVNGVCDVDLILAPACLGYTLVRFRRIHGNTSDFHEAVTFISNLLDMERQQAIQDTMISGASELM